MKNTNTAYQASSITTLGGITSALHTSTSNAALYDQAFFQKGSAMLQRSRQRSHHVLESARPSDPKKDALSTEHVRVYQQ